MTIFADTIISSASSIVRFDGARCNPERNGGLKTVRLYSAARRRLSFGEDADDEADDGEQYAECSRTWLAR